MTDFERKRFYGSVNNIRGVCGVIAGLMFALIPIIGSFSVIADGSVLTTQFFIISGASVAAAAIVGLYGEAVARTAARRSPEPEPATKSVGFLKLGGVIALGFLALPVIVGSLMLIQSGDVVNFAFIVTAVGSVAAAALILLYAYATARTIRRFSKSTGPVPESAAPRDSAHSAITASDAARRALLAS